VEEDRVTTYHEKKAVEVKYRSCGPLSKPCWGIYPKIRVNMEGSCLYIPGKGNICGDFNYKEAAEALQLKPFIGCMECNMEGCKNCWKDVVDDYWRYDRIFGPKGRKAPGAVKFNRDGSYKIHFLQWMYNQPKRHAWLYVHVYCRANLTQYVEYFLHDTSAEINNYIIP
jgi:hypothetical protein